VSAPDALLAALARRRAGHGLPRPFAIDASIYAYELDAIWRTSWLFAGCAVQAPEPRAFFRFELGEDSVVIARDDAGVLHALHNTCRHRGMRICDAARGRAAHFVCPYHQWSYGLDGRLLGCGGMELDLDADEYGLRCAGVAEIGGLVFVWLGPDPAPLGAAADELHRALSVQGLDRARVAHQIDYEVKANWKLIWENNRECWHCPVGHPQYVKANFDASRDTERARALAAARARDHARMLAADLVASHETPGLYPFPTPGRWWSANRTPLAPGFVSESIDGRPVAPLMGGYAGYDAGTLRVRTVPNFWCHASADHAVLTRLAPAGPERTLVSVQWLVEADAVAGRDYELDRLLPFWKLTSEQDWELCERNQAGVRSPAFTPGPYSPAREYNVIAFVDWYLERIRQPWALVGARRP
jgi:Rieske 2Fe-2S family protein